MHKYFITALYLLLVNSFYANSQDVIRINAASAIINPQSSEIVDDDRLSAKKGVTLKPGIISAIDGGRNEPDIVFDVKVPSPGLYVMNTYALTDTEGAALMKNASSKFESMYIRIQVDDQRPTKRVVYVPWDIPSQESGKFSFTGKDQKLKIWLPRGVKFEYVRLSAYVPPSVPEKVKNYSPSIIPPANHPRLFVNSETLPVVKSRLESAENRDIWIKVKALAEKKFEFSFAPESEISYDASLETAARSKAFYYLMTNDKTIGREAVDLMSAYLSHVEFGNLLDITREIGRAIYSASLVYDWCNDLFTINEKQILLDNLLRLSRDMECGWPPFRQSIINGHGSEAQISRDLLTMSIAVYSEDPVPYKYCSYRVLEELVPMRNWEYQSPRHNQGVNYGAHRITWDLHAAWLFYRMTGKPVFNDNIKGVPAYWLYMRLPDGQMFRDGDGFNTGTPGELYYWSRAQLMFLFYNYSGDPVIKGEFERMGGQADDPLLFLLLNDPSIKTDKTFKTLPLTKDFGPILGSMIARTGWNSGLESNDVVAEIKGGGYHFGNHQHCDAGSLQIYYRGFQVADIGLYGFYGPPYDFNFNKRSVAHSMMLARDPSEKFGNTESNDGGVKFNQRNPVTPVEATSNPIFINGKIISSDFGPSNMKPSFSYFDVDLVGAYTSKISAYNRRFLFLNLGNDSIPAAIILSDDMTTTHSEFKKYWQVNTHNKPDAVGNIVVLNNSRKGLVGKTHINMLIPAPEDREVNVLSGADATTSFEFRYEVPVNLAKHPEAQGHRIMVSPKNQDSRDNFLTVFQMTAGNTEPLPVNYKETEESYIIYLANRVVSINKNNELISKGFSFEVIGKEEFEIVLTGLKAGEWKINGKKMVVEEGKNTIFFRSGKKSYSVTPVKI